MRCGLPIRHRVTLMSPTSTEEKRLVGSAHGQGSCGSWTEATRILRGSRRSLVEALMS